MKMTMISSSKTSAPASASSCTTQDLWELTVHIGGVKNWQPLLSNCKVHMTRLLISNSVNCKKTGHSIEICWVK